MKTEVTIAILAVAIASSVTVSVSQPASATKHTVKHPQIAAAPPVAKRKVMKGKIERDVAMADGLMLKGKYSDAADLYRQAISRNAKNVPAIVGLGMALGRQFKLDGAEEQFDKAMALDPQNAMAHVGKAMVMTNRLQSSSTTITKQRESTLKQAEDECKQALSIDPNIPEGHYTLGMVYKEQGNLDQAVNEFQLASKNDAQFSDAFAGLGMTKLAQGSLFEAAENFKRAIAINTGNSTAHYGLGKTLLKQGLVDAAIKELNTSLYQFPNSGPVHQAMGEAYETQGNTVAAVKEYQESIRIKPENPEAYLHIADIREARGDLEHSIAELRSGLELMPGNPDLHLRIADESLRLEKLDDAINEYKAVLDQNPGSAQAAKGLTRGYYLKAQKEATGAFMVSNEYERADQYIDQAIRMNPNDMELRLAQAKLRSMSGKQVDLASLGTPRSDGERVAYAEALLAQNRFGEARDQMNMVIGNANDAKQTFAVADLALMIRDLDSAEAAYRKASAFPDGQERAQRGMDLVSKAREAARQNLTLANDLARKKQLASSVDKYHAAIFGNPKVSEARLGLAQTLERLSPAAPADLREAAVQYRAYMALEPNMPPKEKERYSKRITNDESKAFKLEQKLKRTATR